jgi:hypothetical protein
MADGTAHHRIWQGRDKLYHPPGEHLGSLLQLFFIHPDSPDILDFEIGNCRKKSIAGCLNSKSPNR